METLVLLLFLLLWLATSSWSLEENVTEGLYPLSKPLSLMGAGGALLAVGDHAVAAAVEEGIVGKDFAVLAALWAVTGFKTPILTVLYAAADTSADDTESGTGSDRDRGSDSDRTGEAAEALAW